MSTIDDAFPKSPDQVRQEKTIEWLHCLHKEMSTMNKNLAIVGEALIKIANPMIKVEAERSKGKRLANNVKQA